jgi:hypothetical protein
MYFMTRDPRVTETWRWMQQYFHFENTKLNQIKIHLLQSWCFHAFTAMWKSKSLLLFPSMLYLVFLQYFQRAVLPTILFFCFVFFEHILWHNTMRLDQVIYIVLLVILFITHVIMSIFFWNVALQFFWLRL